MSGNLVQNARKLGQFEVKEAFLIIILWILKPWNGRRFLPVNWRVLPVNWLWPPAVKQLANYYEQYGTFFAPCSVFDFVIIEFPLSDEKLIILPRSFRKVLAARLWNLVVHIILWPFWTTDWQVPIKSCHHPRMSRKILLSWNLGHLLIQIQ